MSKRESSEKKPFISKIDIIILVSILMLISAVGIVVKLVLQKDTEVTVELLAAGGEWWWGVPPPYYWNAKEVQIGAKEFDTFKHPQVEIVDLVKYGEDDRKFMWMKVKLRAKRNYLTNEYIFRQEPLKIGKTIHISPNNIALIGQVVGIEGIGKMWDTEYIVLTGKALKIQRWEAEAIHVGDTIKDNKGAIIAQVLEKSAEQSNIMTVNWTGDTFNKKDPILQDVTMKLRLRVMRDGERRFFNYYQSIAIGNRIRIQFPTTAFEVNIVNYTSE